MNLPQIAVPRHLARQHFLDYRRAVRTRAEKDDHTLMVGYRALARGKRVISGAEAIAQGGVGTDGLPRLALVRADAERCFVRYSAGGRVEFCANGRAFGQRVHRSLRRAFGPETLPRWTPPVERRWETLREGEARVPLVPPRFRPAHALSNYFVLWEATWSRLAPKDPALLKDIGGGLYVVLAIWDLTPLEQAVLGVRS